MPTSPSPDSNDANAKKMRMIYGQLALAQTILLDEIADIDQSTDASKTSPTQNV